MLADLKIRTKIWIATLVMLLAFSSVWIAGQQGLAAVGAQAVEFSEHRLPAVHGLEKMLGGLLHVAAGQRGLVHKRMMDSETRQANYDEVAAGLLQAAEGKKAYERLSQNQDETRIWNGVLSRWDEWQRVVQTVVEMSREKDSLVAAGAKLDDPRVLSIDDRALDVVRRSRQVRMEINRLVDELVQLNNDYAKLGVKQAELTAKRYSMGLILAALIGGGMTMAFVYFAGSSIITALLSVQRETKRLTEAATAGRLSVRAEEDAVPPEFRGVMRGFNETLDAVIVPLNVAADYVDRISRGDIPPPITATYQGDFNTIKDNLNRCVEAVNALVADADALVRAAIGGKLSTRADATKHEGDFRKVVDGVNKTLDAVITPVMEATNALELLACYDLRARVKGDYQGDHARIKDAVNSTAQALHDALSQVADAVDQVAEASQQIAGSSQSVSQGASEQASALEETSSSLEQMAGMTKQNADNTTQARSLAQTTKEAAEKGGDAMERMTDAMEKIQAASESTAQIIKDINDIAFQTNLLALNAAVEAARAGDAGRGFAVVAEEVRNLALRSKEAAKKTEDLIRVAVGHAENGRMITVEVAESLTEIVTAASKVNDIVSEIAVASQEQSRGIEQVNKAVSEMDKVVQTAASNAEESSSAAEELAGQSEELASLVQRFMLDRENRRTRLHGNASGKDASAGRRGANRIGTIPRGAGAGSRGRKAYDSGVANAARKLTPEELIPLESDPEFQDF